MMQIFSKADIDKRGELRFAEFRNSLDHMKNYLVIEIMDQLGYSVRDLGWSVTFSITILILMFAFIFVGIEAFAPYSSFSGVTNMILPLGAGGAVNKNPTGPNTSQQQLQTAAAGKKTQ